MSARKHKLAEDLTRMIQALPDDQVLAVHDLTHKLGLMEQTQQAAAAVISASQRQTCKVCGRPDKFDFHVDDSVWERVVPPAFRNRVVCLYCFDDFAASVSVGYAHSLGPVHFAGDGASFCFSVQWWVE